MRHATFSAPGWRREGAFSVHQPYMVITYAARPFFARPLELYSTFHLVLGCFLFIKIRQTRRCAVWPKWFQGARTHIHALAVTLALPFTAVVFRILS